MASPDDIDETASSGELPFYYPTHLIDVWNVGCERLTVRPILPQDQGPLGDMLYRTSAAARRARFHGVINHFADETLRAMTRLDFREVLALVVTTGSATDRETLIADARYVVGLEGADAEFAVLIDDAWQRRGVGTRLVRTMLDAASRAGLRQLRGSVMRTNTAMLSLLRQLQFSCANDPDDARLVRVNRRVVPCCASVRSQAN